MGAAVASTVGYTAAGGTLIVFFLRESGLRWQETLLPKWHELVGHLSWAKESFQNRMGRPRGSREGL